jgi:hypothetical protein
MKASNHTRGKDIYFYKIGFGGSDRLNEKNWTIRTFSTLVSHFNDAYVSKQLIKNIYSDFDICKIPAISVINLISGSTDKSSNKCAISVINHADSHYCDMIAKA